jgi:CheY-like chemotaxis protein
LTRRQLFCYETVQRENGVGSGGNPFANDHPRRFRLSQKLPILVVDDDDAIRTMVERVLRREHFEVEGARDGFEAIEKLTRNDYGTVLLDLMMPRVDGHGVLRFLEQHPKPARVIVMTANMQGGSDAADARPVFRVLSKPFDIQQLISHVRDCVTPAGSDPPKQTREASRAAVDVQPG